MTNLATTRELITPAQAKVWLTENNTRNRPMSVKAAAIYAKDMLDGNWHDTHQGIAFYDDGTLADGQTRLAAICLAAKPMEMLITRGLPLNSCIGIDAHRMRSASDQIKITGLADWISSQDIAIVKMINEIRTGSVGRSSTTHIVDLCQEFHAPLEFVRKNVTTTIRHVTNAPTRVAIAMAFMHVNQSELCRFCSALCTGIIDRQDESSVIRLREKLMASGGVFQRNFAGRHEQVRLTERAIKAFCDGERITKLFAPKYHIFPLS